jgi:DNA-binding Xre family transcriptional regulator
MTQQQLAWYLGVADGSVRRWERGETGFAWIARVAHICELLNCSVHDLVEWDDDKNDSDPPS